MCEGPPAVCPAPAGMSPTPRTQHRPTRRLSRTRGDEPPHLGDRSQARSFNDGWVLLFPDTLAASTIPAALLGKELHG